MTPLPVSTPHPFPPDLSALQPGFADPARDAQCSFRLALQALARPGQVQTLPPALAAALVAPAGLQPGLAALLLTLLDGDTSLWLSPRWQSAAMATWLGFHTGVLRVEAPEAADFVLADGAEVDASLWPRLCRGEDEVPEQGATLLLALPALADPLSPAVYLQGPGLPAPRRLQPPGLDAAFWPLRQADEAAFPRGVDIFMAHGAQWLGLPRSTRIRPL